MSPVSSIRLLLSDVDGTLVTHDKVLTSRACAAVLGLRQKNIRFAITSGRPPLGMRMFVDPLTLAEPIAGFNGGAYVAPDLHPLENHVLSSAAAERAVQLFSNHGVDVWLYTGDEWYVTGAHGAHVAREAQTVSFMPKVVDSFSGLFDRAVKVVGVSDDATRIRDAEKAIVDSHSDVSASLSQPYYIDVTNPVANKAAVVRYHAARLGILPSEIATIGDMPNDVLMFRESGFSVAMGNGSSDVQAEAVAVTDSCDNDGFAKAVERYFLGE